MKAFENLPENYRPIYAVDLKKDKKAYLLVNGISLLIAALFVIPAVILSPFIEPDTLNAMFGKSMLDDESLKLYFAQLIGKEAQKPFECVGTVDEVNSALTLTIERFYSSNNRPLLLKDYELGSAVVPLNTLSDEHNVPKELLTLFTLEQ